MSKLFSRLLRIREVVTIRVGGPLSVVTAVCRPARPPQLHVDCYVAPAGRGNSVLVLVLRWSGSGQRGSHVHEPRLRVPGSHLHEGVLLRHRGGGRGGVRCRQQLRSLRLLIGAEPWLQVLHRRHAHGPLQRVQNVHLWQDLSTAAFTTSLSTTTLDAALNAAFLAAGSSGSDCLSRGKLPWWHL